MSARLLIPALAALTLAACTQKSAPPAPPPPPDITHTTDEECAAQRLGRFLNELPTDDVMARIRGVVGERPIRTIHPGDAVTMDFAPQRLNVELGDDSRIKRFRCG
jgi:hypothetical protein